MKSWPAAPPTPMTRYLPPCCPPPPAAKTMALLQSFGQSIDRKHVDEDGVDEGSSCLAYRTRSKLPLVNIPLDQLEAELLAPDITADMYDQSSAHRDEDCHWTNWLQSLMAPDCEGQKFFSVGCF